MHAAKLASVRATLGATVLREGEVPEGELGGVDPLAVVPCVFAGAVEVAVVAGGVLGLVALRVALGVVVVAAAGPPPAFEVDELEPPHAATAAHRISMSAAAAARRTSRMRIIGLLRGFVSWGAIFWPQGPDPVAVAGSGPAGVVQFVLQWRRR
jgi:hypothetical protein